MQLPLNPSEILVVEDEGIVARDIQQQLTGLGYVPVGHATTAEQAIVLADSLQPDLVLMDIRLAGPMDGVAAADAICARRDVPIVFITAFADGGLRTRVGSSGHFLLKPFDELELGAVLAAILGRSSPS